MMTQYWLVGANWNGYDMTSIFIQQGYWIMGHNDESREDYTRLRDNMELPRFRGQLIAWRQAAC